MEAYLDFQCAIPIVYPQTTTDFQTDDINGGYFEGIFNNFFDGEKRRLIANAASIVRHKREQIRSRSYDGSYCTYSAYGETGDAKGIDPTYPDPRNGTYSDHGKLGYKGKLQCGVFRPTNVISSSYGVFEALPYYYHRRQWNEALKLGLQGVTILVSSGGTCFELLVLFWFWQTRQIRPCLASCL